MRIPSDYNNFDFAFPLGAYGRSSGWRDINTLETMTSQPQISARRLLGIKTQGTSIFISFMDGEFRDVLTDSIAPPFAFAIKTDLGMDSSPDKIVALSSGAGSALLRDAGVTYKMKRCGLCDIGVGGEIIHAQASTFMQDNVVEFSAKCYAGLMTLESALHECEMFYALKRDGLNSAYTPVGVIMIIDNPLLNSFSQQFGVVVTKVTSDLRLDELVYMALSPMLAELLENGSLEYRIIDGQFLSHALQIVSLRRKWEHVYNFIHILGMCAGGAFKNLHASQYFRGRSSSWFGNEVIGLDGTVSFVDLDGGTESASRYPADLRKEIQLTEVEDYCAGVCSYLSWGFSQLMGSASYVFIQGFRHGYLKGQDGLPQKVVRTIIDEHLKSYQVLDKYMDLSCIRSAYNKG